MHTNIYLYIHSERATITSTDKLPALLAIGLHSCGTVNAQFRIKDIDCPHGAVTDLMTTNVTAYYIWLCDLITSMYYICMAVGTYVCAYVLTLTPGN